MNQSAIAGKHNRPAEAQSLVAPPLQGSWLLVARAGWVALVLLVLALNVIAIPTAIETLRVGCQTGAQCLGVQMLPTTVRQLQQMGMTPAFLAVYQAAGSVTTLLVYVALAAIIFWRRSADRMALFCAYMLVLVGGAGYTGLLDDGLRPLAPAWYWPVGILELFGLVCLLSFFLLFPRGRFVPRWTRWWAVAALLLEVHYVFFNIPDQAANRNPDGVPIDFLAFAALALSLVALQVYRYRRISTFRERQQTKWVVFGFSLAMVGYLISFTLEHLSLPQRSANTSALLTLVAGTLSIAFLLLMPLSIAVAILRSRLYDIDVIIRRTLVYGSLTAILAGVYMAGVIGVQTIVNSIARDPQGKTSPVLVVVTTLLIAALFQPLRRRLQRVIDRRFYRRKYNVERTLASFSATLRSDVDLPHLTDHLVGVVAETMQPVHVSLWLRAPTEHH